MQTKFPPIHLHKEVFPFLNISLYLNNIPFIQSLSIENTSEIDTGFIEIRITPDVPCFEAFSYTIENIPAGKDIKVAIDNLKVNRAFFSKLSEVEKANIHIQVLHTGEVIIKENVSCNIHPLEYFGGFHILPELIVTYITPNHPYVYHIKRKAIGILEKQGLQTAFEGYQNNNPERVLQMMSAIYSAIQGEEIVYSALPPAYESVGQRLRLLSTIQNEKFGNCIDLSLLFAACLEAVDLNPIIIITKGHAFVGCWLHDNKFSEIVIDDKAAITKRMAKGIREMAAIEATIVCKGNAKRFTDAMNAGEAQLVEKEDFLLAIDVKRARTIRIRPLPLMLETSQELEEADTLKKTTTADIENAFEIGDIYQESELDGGRRPLTKQKLWERKLLDLSLRNNLLNMRMTRNMLQLVDIDISHLEDTLADGKTFSILPAANAEILRKYNLFAGPLHHSSHQYQMANEELKHNRLLTNYHQADLDNILTHMHKSAKMAIEENGSSTLYLAVGLLKWYDSKTPDQPRYAPVLMIPVEISRRSVNSKFNLKSREEEAMINITLLEFLRQEYQLNLTALETLPTDDKGVNVAKVMGILRRAVMQLKGWDVEEQLVLGNFSFSKLILWKDIVIHQQDLLKSDMVRSLVEGKISFAGMSEENVHFDPEQLHASKISLPIATDVSQMEAVITAQQGKSFILHGPPGTGKSQTITNIIADALNHGKRVLFVAAKKAALDVVHNRLEGIGLGPFSLELHSNKSGKPGVLAQLEKSLAVTKTVPNTLYGQEAERLETSKKTISEYVKVLHQVQLSSLSLHDCIAALESYRKKSLTEIEVPQQVLEKLNNTQKQQWEDWLPRYQSVSGAIVHPAQNPFQCFSIQHYTVQTGDEIVSQTNQLFQLLIKSREITATVCKAIHFPFSVQQYHHLLQLREVLSALKNIPDASMHLWMYLAIKDNRETIEEWIKHFTIYKEAIALLLTNHERNVMSADLGSLEKEWKEAQQTWFLPKWIKKSKIKKQLLVFCKRKLENDSQVETLFTHHNKYKECERLATHNRYDDAMKALGKLYKDEETDVLKILQIAQAIQRLANKADKWQTNSLSVWTTAWKEHGLEYPSEIIHSAGETLDSFLHTADEIIQKANAYHLLTGVDIRTGNSSGDWLEYATNQIELVRSHLPQLKNWMTYANVRNEGQNMQLHWLIKAFEEEQLTTPHISEVFYYSMYSSIAKNIIAQHESLNFFNKELYAQKIELYRKVAKSFREQTKTELVTKLAAQLPHSTVEATRSSELSILQKAIKSRGRGMSIRRLFEQIPTLLPRLAPCMLMSPISVAQYFNVDTRHFDLVIFDEASQLPTCEAVSALARAKQAIIVGDPRQMPPTSFFSTVKVDEENMEVEDLESILDDCLALSIPSKYLLRHYRSQHESLIAFSNVNYYDNKLLTFPSADDLDRKVKYHHIKGFYDKGKTRQNKFEADAIIQFIKKHLEDKQRKTLSLGVVTFSQTQQSLVEDKLQELFSTNPELEKIANESAEPLFIKNLENVQGDERDIILFSICYAQDEEGKLSMNFGPLNRDGGWRRLNVAVTRARNEMHVFATLRPDQVDLGRTSSAGVAGLKAFLQFAENGHLAIRPDELLFVEHAGIVRAISEQLAERGYPSRSNIGTSAFKIDIGIIHPEKPNVFILGIVTDGKYYRDAQTSNDRESVLPGMLKNLGWNIHRVWAMDWYENSGKIVDDIIANIDLLKTQLPEELVQIIEPAEALPEEQITAGIPLSEILADSKRKPYTAHYLTPMANGTFEAIYEFQNRNKIKEQILAVINVEAPISKGLLYKKVLQAWNTSRAGSRLDKHLETIIGELGINLVHHHQPFYWSKEVDTMSIDWYRSNDTERRNIEDIAPEELKVAITEVVHQNLSLEENELLRHIAKVFGFAKVGKQIDTILLYSLEMAVKEGVLRRENGRVRI